jgi:hypothetical protein
VHRSELDILIFGDIADGGGEFTVVSDLESVVTVLLVVESVTIGSATATLENNITIIKTKLLNFISLLP